MMWLAAALGSSVLTANNAEMNRRYQQEGFRLNLWRTLLLTVFWAPLALLMPWPSFWSDMGFYGSAIFGGLGMIVGNMVQADLSARHNGRVAILHMPLKALFVYVLWLGVDTRAREHLLATPLTTATVIGCFLVMVAAMNAMRRNDASLQALKAIVPVVVLYGLGDVLTRLMLPGPGGAHGVGLDMLGGRLVVYLFLMTGVSAGASLLVWCLAKLTRGRGGWVTVPKPQQPLYSPRLLQAASRAAFSSGLNHVCFMIGLTQAPNPAYVSMVGLLAPVWLLAWHRWHGVRDEASPAAGMVLVIAALVLMGVTL